MEKLTNAHTHAQGSQKHWQEADMEREKQRRGGREGERERRTDHYTHPPIHPHACPHVRTRTTADDDDDDAAGGDAANAGITQPSGCTHWLRAKRFATFSAFTSHLVVCVWCACVHSWRWERL